MLPAHPEHPCGSDTQGLEIDGQVGANPPLRGAELRSKTQSVFEANIWTISRLCLNEASTANS